MGWAVAINLYDDYLHVSIHQDSPRLLAVQYLNQTFLYQILPFGLKDFPGVFHQDRSNAVTRKGKPDPSRPAYFTNFETGPVQPVVTR